MMTLKELLRLPRAERRRLDIALVNLICAMGLPGTEKLDAELCLRTIDAMAETAGTRTDAALPRFRQRPEAWYFSEGTWRIHCLWHVLHKHFGVRYNMEKVPDDAPFYAEDVFIHGIIQGAGGTCASLPVLYAAVGRRLGYPLKLVYARGEKSGHQFLRWDDPNGERFNIEITDGFGSPPDDHYRTGRYAPEPVLEERGVVLKSKTPDEELASFLGGRADIWKEAGADRQSMEDLAWAHALVPSNPLYGNGVARGLDRWHTKLEARKPPLFPEFICQRLVPFRVYPASLPLLVENDILYLSILEFLLNDPEHILNWWEPMRREWPPPPRMLTRIIVNTTPSGYDVRMIWTPDPKKIIKAHLEALCTTPR